MKMFLMKDSRSLSFEYHRYVMFGWFSIHFEDIFEICGPVKLSVN